MFGSFLLFPFVSLALLSPSFMLLASSAALRLITISKLFYIQRWFVHQMSNYFFVPILLERRSKKNAHHWRIHEKSAFKNNSTTVYDLLLHKSGLVWAFRSVFLLDLCYSFLWREFLSFSCSSLCAFFVFVVAICDVPKFILFNKCYACMNTPG